MIETLTHHTQRYADRKRQKGSDYSDNQVSHENSLNLLTKSHNVAGHTVTGWQSVASA